MQKQYLSDFLVTQFRITRKFWKNVFSVLPGQWLYQQGQLFNHTLMCYPLRNNYNFQISSRPPSLFFNSLIKVNSEKKLPSIILFSTRFLVVFHLFGEYSGRVSRVRRVFSSCPLVFALLNYYIVIESNQSSNYRNQTPVYHYFIYIYVDIWN